jgi:hypothetical protein
VGTLVPQHLQIGQALVLFSVVVEVVKSGCGGTKVTFYIVSGDMRVWSTVWIGEVINGMKTQRIMWNGLVGVMTGRLSCGVCSRQ